MRLWVILSIPLGLVLASLGEERRRPSWLTEEARGSGALTAQVDSRLATVWAEAGVAPVETVDVLGFGRRVWIDVLGTIPSLEEVRRWERDLPAEPAAARAALIDQALQDRRFAEAFAERLARIAVGADGKQDDLLYRRRRLVSWLAQQVQRSRPWDAIVRELIVATGISTDTPATNFVIAQDLDPVKLAARSTRAFLGVRIDCAQCHDHPFYDWTQADFEGLSAWWSEVEQRDLPGIRDNAGAPYRLEDPTAPTMDPDAETPLRVVAPAVPFAADLVPRDWTVRREAYAAWLTHPENPYFAKAIVNRLWGWLLGTGLVDPVDELDVSQPLDSVVLELLADDLVASGFVLQRTVRAILSSAAYARASTVPAGADEDALREVYAAFPLKRLRAQALGSALVQATSVWTFDGDRNQVVRLVRFFGVQDFTKRHGEDLDAEGVEPESLLQRLHVMNARQLHERTKEDNAFAAVRRVPWLTGSAEEAVEVAYLMALTRRPTAAERAVFEGYLEEAPRGTPEEQAAAFADVLAALVNTTEFAWNH